MIPARKTPLFNRFFANHSRGRICSMFEEVRVFGLSNAIHAAREAPVLIVANHTAWWDPLLAIALSNYSFGADAYAMMDAANLMRLPFFSRVGAFGVDLNQPEDGARAIRYAAKLLSAPGRMVWIFAQGEERPITAPLSFRAGAAQVARVSKNAKVIPLALRYEFGKGEKPMAYVSIGGAVPLSADVQEANRAQEEAVRGELRRIDRHLCGSEESAFEVVFRARKSRFATWAETVLAWVAR